MEYSSVEYKCVDLQFSIVKTLAQREWVAGTREEMRGAGCVGKVNTFISVWFVILPPPSPRIHPWEEGIARENQYVTNQFNSSISHLPLADSASFLAFLWAGSGLNQESIRTGSGSEKNAL